MTHSPKPPPPSAGDKPSPATPDSAGKGPIKIYKAGKNAKGDTRSSAAAVPR